MARCQIILLIFSAIYSSAVMKSDYDNFRNTLLTPINTSIEPCTDFYQYACGNWKNLNLNLSDEYFGSGNLQIVKRTVNEMLIELLSEDAAEISSSNSSFDKAKRFYSSCLKSEKDDGLPILSAVLKSFSDWPILNPDWKEAEFDWLYVASKLRLYGVHAILNEAVGPHWNDSAVQLIYFVSPKFDFVHKEDLLGNSRNSEQFVFFYTRYIKLLMNKLGLRIRKAKEVANEIVEFETKLAEIIPNEVEIDPPEPITVESLKLKIPLIDWDKYLSGIFERPINASSLKVIIHEEYYQKLTSLISRTERKTIAHYLLFKFMFNFKVAVGEKLTVEQCLQEVIKKMSTVGEMYVRRYFQLENKKFVTTIVENVREAFQETLTSSSWLDLPTKQSALEKLQGVSAIIGYPDHILSANDDLENVEITADDYYTNSLNFARYETIRDHIQLYAGQRPWTPSAVDTNAFYKTTKNSIFIPAGLLLPPIFHRTFPNFHNYAVLGAIIGHELTHGFDFEGRNYDLTGSAKNWWSSRSLIGYYAHMECILSQHNNFSATHSERSRAGIGSISENLADNGGIRLAYKAYKNWMKNNDGKDLKIMETLFGVNMTSEQLFFLSFAQFWCSSNTEGHQGGGESHSPNEYRVIGSLSNFPHFAEAFNCSIGSQMNPIRKCELW